MPRPRKGPHIYRREDRAGLWGYIDRDHKDISLGTENEAEALDRLGKLVDEHSRLPGEARSGSSHEVTLAALFDRRLDELHSGDKSRTTARDAKNDALRWLKWFATQAPPITYPAQIDPDVLRRYRAFRRPDPATKRKSVSQTRVNHELTNLKMAMVIGTESPYNCVSDEQIQIFKKARLKEPRPLRHQLKMTFEERDKFFKTITSRDPRYARFCEVLDGTAMRELEVIHLDESDIIENVDDDVYELCVSNKPPGWCKCHPKGWTTKNYRCRRIPVERHVVESARAFLRARDESPHFTRGERKILAVQVCTILRGARLGLGLNRSEAARRAQIGYRSYYYYESGRRVPSPTSCAAMEAAFGLPDGHIPRLSRRGMAFSLDPKRIWTEISSTCRQAGIRHFSAHGLRHAWASRMFNAGYGIEQISKWLGHSDVEVTKRYLGLTDEHRPTSTEIHQRLAKLRGRPKRT